MRVVSIASPSFGSNTYLLIADGQAFVVDPAVSSAAVFSAADAEGVCLQGILLTHGHFDHMLSVEAIREAAKIPVMIHKDDAELLSDGKKNAFYAVFGKDRAFPPADRLLKDGDALTLGSETIRVLHTPGHTRGSCCYVCGEHLITGDTVFAEGFGRYDLYGGSEAMLKSSLSHLRTLNPKLRIYPGHGPSAFLGDALDTFAYFL